ncbi:MAG TPA: tail fiber protein [Candidatus Baltobacteraceae bacterium]
MAAEPFLVSITIWPANFAPIGWAFCAGQILPIAQNTAVFSLLGTTYGGNGTSNFALPDLRGRIPIGAGQGPGLSPYVIGQMGGTENTALTQSQMPSHTHGVNASSSIGNTASPAGGLLAPVQPGTRPEYYSAVTSSPATMSPVMIQSSGGSQPFSLLQPYLSLNYIIALQGVFPSRN